MSKVVNMVGGGSSGGGISANDAVLLVTVPTGSTVTATKGGVALTPTMWVTAANPTLDCAIFIIKASLFDAVNPWTVTATLGTDTASDTVVVDSNKEYDVELPFTLWLVKNGVLKKALSATNRMEGVAGAEYYTLSQAAGSGGCAAGWLIDKTITYSNLVFVFVKAGTSISTGQSDRCGIGTGPVPNGSISDQSNTYIAYSAILPLNNDFETRTIALNNINVYGKYVQLSCDWGGNGRLIAIKDAYLEP